MSGNLSKILLASLRRVADGAPRVGSRTDVGQRALSVSIYACALPSFPVMPLRANTAAGLRQTWNFTLTMFCRLRAAELATPTTLLPPALNAISANMTILFKSSYFFRFTEIIITLFRALNLGCKVTVSSFDSAL